MRVDLGRVDLIELGNWLDMNMPNPPLPDPQRWNVVNSDSYVSVDFDQHEDAIYFQLRWE